jgi:integrase
MPVKQGSDGRWRYREMVKKPDGTSERITGSAPRHDNNKTAAQSALADHIRRVLTPGVPAKKEEAPTFEEWFEGRFWTEWVVGRKNKPTETRSKRIIFENHIKPYFGAMRIDEIGVGEVARFRAQLVGTTSRFDRPLSEKRINNILAVLSKPLHYAAECEVIAKAPKIGLFKVERPEIVAWEFEQYVRLMQAAKAEGPHWYAAVALAGEAGLRCGEVKALRWREDLDLVGGTVTVNQQVNLTITTTPKGRTRRTIPLTTTLTDALKALEVVRTGLVIRNLDGEPIRDSQANWTITRICRQAGLPIRGWHSLRHTFGTHAALFGVNPWRLQAWMGHKRIDETMLYVHVAESHPRELPEPVQVAGSVVDPDRRVIAMLGARGKVLPVRKDEAAEPFRSSAA